VFVAWCFSLYRVVLWVFGCVAVARGLAASPKKAVCEAGNMWPKLLSRFLISSCVDPSILALLPTWWALGARPWGLWRPASIGLSLDYILLLLVPTVCVPSQYPGFMGNPNACVPEKKRPGNFITLSPCECSSPKPLFTVMAPTRAKKPRSENF